MVTTFNKSLPTPIEQLLPASFKGIPFKIRGELQTDGGRRIILHDYPNSNDRYIEDMGQIPPNFKITAFVTGNDFRTRADKLERALKEGGLGDLQLPTFGLKKVYAMPYQMDASQREVGEIRFELSFVSGRATSGPVRAKPTPQTVYAKGDTARELLGDKLKTNWIEPTQTTDVQAAIFDIGQMVKITNIVISTVNNSSDLESTINLILENAPQIVRSGEAMKSTFMSGLWQSISEGLLQNENFEKMIDLTKFGANLTLSLSDVYRAYDTARDEDFEFGIPTWPATTASRRARNTNRLNLVNSGRVAALVSGYEQAADNTYPSQVEVEETRNLIEVEHNRLMRDDTADAYIIQSDPEVRQAVEEVRLSALSMLDQKEQATFKLTDVNSPAQTSCFLMAYQLYAEDFTTSSAVTEKGVEVRELNPILPADKLVGDLSVLQK